MELTGFDRFLWATGFCCHNLLLLALFRRGRARLFPIFTTFIALNIARAIVLDFVHRDLPGDYPMPTGA